MDRKMSRSPWVIHYDGSSCNGCDIEVLASLTQIVAANKCDLLGDDRTNIDRLRAHVEAQGYEFFEMSAAAHTGTRELIQACAA